MAIALLRSSTIFCYKYIKVTVRVHPDCVEHNFLLALFRTLTLLLEVPNIVITTQKTFRG
jgi:hypothetical protein